MPIDSRNSIYFFKFRILNTVEWLLDVARKSDTAQVSFSAKVVMTSEVVQFCSSESVNHAGQTLHRTKLWSYT